MEKIISINMAGRVIGIEDGAYTVLKTYLESLHGYFANEDGGGEIISDIESRIAELMAEKIAHGVHAIDEAHVAEIIAAMGRAEDFAADDNTSAGTASSAAPNGSTIGKRRFVRDINDKIAGGVCSGLASYLHVDPALVRILFALLTLGGWGTGLLLYIILWIFVPAAPVAPFRGRRLYRNGGDRWLGGVASGVAAYFDKEPWLFRLAFAAPVILSMLTGSMHWLFHSSIFFGSFFGTFVLIYIVLWVVLPVATTDFQKMEMRGEKIDIASIRDNVVADLKDRTATFRTEVSDSASRLKSRGQAFAQEAGAATRPAAARGGQILAGIIKAFLLFIGTAIAFTLFVCLIGYFFGGFSGLFGDFILQTPGQRTLAWLSVLLVLGVPMLALLTGIVRRITRMRAGSNYFRLGYLMLWLTGVVCAAMLAASVGTAFRVRGQITNEIPVLQPRSGKLVLTVPGEAIAYGHTIPWLQGDDYGWDLTPDIFRSAHVGISVTPSPDSQYHVLLNRSSRGSSAADAKRRALDLSYGVQNAGGSDSVLQLAAGYSVTKAQGWRAQEAALEIQVPTGKRLRIDESVEDRLSGDAYVHFTTYRTRNRIHERWRKNWTDYLEANQDYTMNGDGSLTDASGKATGSNDASGKTGTAIQSTAIDSLENAMDALQRKHDALKDREDDDN